MKAESERIRVVAEDWFGFASDGLDTRGSFRGCTTRHIYTKAAHFALIREMLPRGRIVLTTEQETTLPSLLPHLFADEIRENRFVWLAMSFNKTAAKPEILSKMKAYREARRAFAEQGLRAERFTLATDPGEITRAFIAEHLTVAIRGKEPDAKPFAVSPYQSSAFPQIWIASPTQASGELDKVVGFPLVGVGLRRSLKALPFDADAPALDADLRAAIAEHVHQATLQPVSTFANAVCERLSVATRARSGGARLSGAYVQGAVFNPRTLAPLLNIFRVAYTFLEPRPYAAYDEAAEPGADPDIDAVTLESSQLRYPGIDEAMPVRPWLRRTVLHKTPAMRHGIDAHRRRTDGQAAVPDLHRLLHRPWLFAGATVGATLDRSGGRARVVAMSSVTNTAICAGRSHLLVRPGRTPIRMARHGAARRVGRGEDHGGRGIRRARLG